MGLFGKKKEVKETTPVVAKVKVEKTGLELSRNVSGIILKPRITEKAAILGEKNVYTFEIKKNATKYDVRDAIKALYKVTPIRINIVNKQARHSMSRMRGRDMMEHGLRKAYVYLKKGDRIELV